MQAILLKIFDSPNNYIPWLQSQYNDWVRGQKREIEIVKDNIHTVFNSRGEIVNLILTVYYKEK